MKKNVFTFSCVSLVCVMGLTLMSSCLKHDDNTSQQPLSVISVLQASPDAPALDLYFNGNKINSNQLIMYATGGQTQWKAGNYSISFVNNSTSDTILHAQDSIAPGQYYSLIVYDTAPHRSIMFFPEQIDQAQSSTDAYIRFLQLSPDGGTANVYEGTTEIFSQRTFADNLQDASRAKFTTIDQGTYSFTAVSPGGDTLGTLSNVQLAAGRAYTLFLRGLASHDNAPDTLGVKLDLMTNY